MRGCLPNISHRWVIARNCLDQFNDDTLSFAPLFDGTELCVDVADEYWARESVDTLILKAAQVAEPLRGHRLGAWMLAGVIARFAHPYTFVAGLAAANTASNLRFGTVRRSGKGDMNRSLS